MYVGQSPEVDPKGITHIWKREGERESIAMLLYFAVRGDEKNASAPTPGREQYYLMCQ